MEYTLLILLLPVLTFLVLGLSGTKLKPFAAGCIGSLSLGITTLLAYLTAAQYFTCGDHEPAEFGGECQAGRGCQSGVCL